MAKKEISNTRAQLLNPADWQTWAFELKLNSSLDAVYSSQIQKLKELINLSKLCNFQLFASNIEGNICHQKPRNSWG